MATPEVLARLINKHLGDLLDENPNWKIDNSPTAGRGVFAVRDIAPGEVIFRERALLTGPTARKGAIVNTCVCCHQLLPVKNFLCKNKCTLPVCDECCNADIHHNECQLFRRWHPMDLDEKPHTECDDELNGLNAGGDKVNLLSLRILTALRVFSLTKDQTDLIDALQANPDRGYRQEIIKAAQCFRKFPTTDKAFMEKLFHVVGVLNTNAFETPCRVGDHEILLRGIFPLTAIMNHECTPNASHYFDNGKTAIVRAARFIPKGAEVTTTYTKILWSNLTRNIFLKMTKHFTCDCPRCNDYTVS